jgi:uncharacterized protein
MPCKQCGICCTAIRIKFSMCDMKRIIKEQKLKKTDMNFAVKYWKPITPEKALSINPELKDMLLKHNLEGYFYTCRFFNKNNRKCSIHEQRPEVCKNYPKKNETWFYSQQCGYKEEIQ